MKKIVIFISFVFIFLSKVQAQQQYCDCPFPIIFVHGWAGDETSWLEYSKQLYSLWGDSIRIPNMSASNPTGNVFYANLNYEYGNTNYLVDVKVHDDFVNAPLIENSCIYAVSFHVKKDPIFTQPVLITKTHPLFNSSTTDLPDNESSSNQSSAFKQGYALGKAIEKIRQISGKDKVILVGHSMGGLAIREYLQRSNDGGVTHPWWVFSSLSDGHKVQKVFTVGTPHLGSNAGDLSNIINGAIGLDIRSDAVRDLRSQYTYLGIGSGIPGLYLYGNEDYNETDIPILNNYYNNNVNCDIDPPYDIIKGINYSPSVNPWDGTIDNPNMPLPKDLKYTYYVSDKLLQHGSLAVGSDGVVLSDRQYLHNVVNDIKIPFPFDSMKGQYFLSDKFITNSVAAHSGPLWAFYPLNIFQNLIMIKETDDYYELYRGTDESDFPYFAYDIEINTGYTGMSQKRADIVAHQSNILIPGAVSTQDPNIDTDWFKFTVNNTHTGNYKLLLNKVKGSYFRAEVFSATPPMYVNEMDGASYPPVTSPENDNTQMIIDLGALTPGEYWIRITSKVNTVSESLNTYSFRIHDPSVCINPNPQVVSEDCGFLTHEKAIKLNGEIGLDYTIQTIPDIGQNGHFVDCGFPLLLEDVENKTPLKVIVTNTLNPTCTQTLDVLPSESNCDFFGSGLCKVPEHLLRDKDKSLKKIFCDNSNCDIVPANPLSPGNRTAMSINSDLPSALQLPLQRLYVNYLFEESTLGKKIEYYGSLLSDENFDEISQVFSPFFNGNLTISPSDSLLIQAELGEFDIPEVKIARLIIKWKNSLIAWSNNVFSPDSIYQFIIDKNAIDSFQTIINQAINYSQNNGFSSLDSMYNISFNSIANYSLANDPTINPICASVGISLSQKLTMTREAFEGTLKIFNGSTTASMDSIALHLEIKNESGVLSNHLFEIENTSLTALTNINGTGQLAANTEGIAKILFIPEKDAGPTVPRYYSFGGSISYKDPFSNLLVTMPLVPVTLQVNPSPDLFLHYFMQRDILGDDAFTPEVEPSEPARLAVMIENDGYGPAQNVRIQTAQPQVIDNEKGLALQMNLIGSRLQGVATNWGLNNINFGTIPARSTRIGEWWFTSNLLGHFTGYSTQLRHVSSRGNPDLSLISGTMLHELIRSIKIYGAQDDGILDFLTNEVQDAGDHPDAIFTSQGNRVFNVKEASSGQFLNAIQYPTYTTTLQVTPQDSGWFYLKLNDPGQGAYTIVSATRNSDGQVIPLENVWLTYVTIPDSKIQVYEDKFHIVDIVPDNSTRTYTVVWSPKDPNPPKVDTILNVPQTIVGVPHTLLRVKFSEPIVDSTFTIADISLTRQGGTNLIDSTVIISKSDSVTYDVLLNGLTDISGYYVFTTQAAGVVDKTGVPGTTGKSVSWIQHLTGPVVTSFENIIHNTFYQEVDSVLVTFNMPIDTSFLSPASFRWMKNNQYQDDTLHWILADNSFRKFKFSNLSALTDIDGQYKFVVNLQAIRSTTAIIGQDSQFVQFNIDQAGPIITSLVLITESALDNQHKTGAIVTFDQHIDSLLASSYTFRRNEVIVHDSLITIQKLSPSSYKLFWGVNGFDEGTYSFIVSADELSDNLGNSGEGSDSLMWVINRTSNLIFENIVMIPDLGYSSADKISSNRNITLNYEVNENAYNLKIRLQDNGVETTLVSKATILSGTQSETINLPVVGNIQLKIEALDSFGNYKDIIFPVLIDELNLTGLWLMQQNQVLFSHPDSIIFDFNEAVLDSGPVGNSVLKIYRNNLLISDNNLEFVRLNDTLYRLQGLTSIPSTPGLYRVDLNMSAFLKYLTGRSGSGVSSFHWEIFDPNIAPVASAGPDQIIKDMGAVMLDGSASSDPNSDSIRYKWISLNNIPLSNDTLVHPVFVINERHIGKMLSFLLIVSDSTKSSSDLVRIFVELDDILVKTKVILQGPYDILTGLMKDSLRRKELIPMSTPYTNTNLYKFGNDNKTIELSLLEVSGPEAIVDWVYLDLYDIIADSVVRGGSYLLQRNGNIIDTIPGKTPIFENLSQGTYALRIYHRNHLPVMTSENVIINRNEIAQIDLTQDLSKIFGGINAIKVIDGKYSMVAGDVNLNRQIQQTDINQTLPKIGQGGYKIEDIDMNGEIQNTDIQLFILPNLGKGKQF